MSSLAPVRKRRKSPWRHLISSLILMSLWASSGWHAEQPWGLWETYAARFLDGQGRVIDHNAGDGTTTEGEAYAMFFALVANDRTRFDKLFDWTETNLAQGDLTLHLPSWKWGKAPDGSWRLLDTNSAADADMWMAYSLEEAGRLWHDDHYAKVGKAMADRIAHTELVEVPNVGTTVLPGAFGFHPDAATWYLNPSYMPPSLLAYFAQSDPVWRDVSKSLPAVVGSRGGFALDWIRAGSKSAPGAPPTMIAGNGSPVTVDVGSYDAIRVYLWMGIADPATPGVRESMQDLRGMAAYLKQNAGPPRSVDAVGNVTAADGPAGFSAAVIPYLHALKLKQEETRQVDRLGASRAGKDGLYGHGEYYDQNLAMFCTGWLEGRYKFDENGRLKVRWK